MQQDLNDSYDQPGRLRSEAPVKNSTLVNA